MAQTFQEYMRRQQAYNSQRAIGGPGTGMALQSYGSPELLSSYLEGQTAAERNAMNYALQQKQQDTQASQYQSSLAEQQRQFDIGQANAQDALRAQGKSAQSQLALTGVGGLAYMTKDAWVPALGKGASAFGSTLATGAGEAGSTVGAGAVGAESVAGSGGIAGAGWAAAPYALPAAAGFLAGPSVGKAMHKIGIVPNSGERTQSFWGGATTGAAAGAAIGASGGPVVAAVGAVIGGIIGGASGLLRKLF